MKQHRILIIASVVAVLLSIVMIFRTFSARDQFDLAVSESLKTTEGYDQRFIDRVNRLEELLATRAQFGYSGGKDPMTGTRRQVVQPRAEAPSKPIVKSDGTIQAPAPTPAAANPDRVKLTAVIADATGKKITAVVMDGERSYSVDAGDKVAGRRILRITNEGIYMESDSMLYFYDIYGNVVKRNKESGTTSSMLQEEDNQPVELPVKKPQKSQKK
jgi:hypothetical protein